MVRGRANVSAYYSKYKNALQNFNPLPSGIYASAPDFPNNQPLGINAADETIKGVEFELTVIQFRNLSLGFHGSAVDSRVDKRSEAHTSELQSLMRSSHAAFCLNKQLPLDRTTPTPHLR